MVVAGTILSQSVTLIGFVAAAIAVGGFLGHAGPVLAEWREEELRRAAVVGGLWGIGGAVFVIVLSAVIG
jgi:hypothetical protein